VGAGRRAATRLQGVHESEPQIQCYWTISEGHSQQGIISLEKATNDRALAMQPGQSRDRVSNLDAEKVMYQFFLNSVLDYCCLDLNKCPK